MASVTGSPHEVGHAGVELGCPVSCLGVATVADLLRLLAEAGRSVTARRSQLAEALVVVPHVHERVMLDCPVACLDLSPHALNPLRANYCEQTRTETVGDLIRLLQSEELGDVRNLGPRRVSEVRAALIAAGFSVQDYPFLER